MTNVLWLQNHGVDFPNAYVGDMASETVVSHNVMVSGLFPKHMGWSDEAFRDVDNLLRFRRRARSSPAAIWATPTTSSSSQAAGNYPKLGDYLHAKFPGTIVANVGQKGYQVESMAAESSDYYVRMGSKKNTAELTDSLQPRPACRGSARTAAPSGNVPSYIKNDPRYLVSVGNNLAPASPNDYYGTKTDKPAWLYPEDGRYVPSPYTDPSAYHESGDAWVADAAMEIMEHEDWSGLFVTLSAMDKIGHMWGGGSVDNLQELHLGPELDVQLGPHAVRGQNADDQLGRIIAKLKELEASSTRR